MLRTTAKLSADAWGMGEHGQLMKLVDLAGSYDQLDLTNCSWAEAAFRRAQVVEWVYNDRTRDADHGFSDKLSPAERAAFSGSTRAGESVMVCPALLSHVKTVVEADVNILKSVRKAREDRELKRGRA